MILGLPPSPNFVDFDAAGEGNCFIYHLSYANISGLEIDQNINQLSGCFSLSNALLVTRDDPMGGTYTPDQFVFCIDSISDLLSETFLNGASGTNSEWIVADGDSMIIAVVDSISKVDFDAAGPGTCLVWHISYGTEIFGLEAGSFIDGIDGCYDLSNQVTVIRTLDSVVCATAIQDISLDINFEIYPNPTRGSFVAEYADLQSLKAEFRVINSLGHIVQKQKISAGGGRIEGELSAHPSGIYIVGIFTEDGISHRKLILIE